MLRDHCDLYNAALEERREAWRMRQESVSYGMQSAQLKDIRRADLDGQGLHSFTAKVCQHRPVPGTVKALQFKREHRRWYVIVISEREPVPLPVTGREAGVDVGVARFLTTSDDQAVANPRFLAASAEVIVDLERRKARTRPGSGNRKRLRRALARQWRKVRHRRRDFHHKTARRLVNQCDAIALENLNTAGMTKRPEPRPDPENPGAFLPNGAAAKAGLNRSILDAGRAPFASILAAKAEEAGRRVVLVNSVGTSIGCHRCGRRCSRPQQKIVICQVHDADLNGARNIYARAGLGSDQATTAA